MTGGNVAERASELYTALAAGDRDTLESLLAPDFSGRTTAGLPLNLGGVFRGRTSMIEDFWWVIGRHFALRAQPESFTELTDGRLQVTGTYVGSARATGRTLEARFVHLLSFDGDRISELEQITDSAPWHDAMSGAPQPFPAYAGPEPDTFETITLEISDGVAQLRLNRPEHRNAIDLRVADESLAAARTIAADPTVRAVLISGAGPWLTAGGDISYFRQWPADALPAVLRRMTTAFHESIRILSEIDAPVVTAAQGSVAGGGLGYLYLADVAIAADDAIFSTAFTGLGLSGDGGGTWFLPRLIGLARAKRMYVENLRIDAATALSWGLVAEVVPAAELHDHAKALAIRLAHGPTRGLGMQRKLLRETWNRSLAEQLHAETNALAQTADTVDAPAAVQAFLNKQRPVFEGR